MAHPLNSLTSSVNSAVAKAVTSGLSPIQLLLAVLTVILLILFVGFLLSGRRRGKESATEESPRPTAPHTPDDGVNPQDRVIYHAQPRTIAPFVASPEQMAESNLDPVVVEPAAAVEPDPPPQAPAPAELPVRAQPAVPLTAWARTPTTPAAGASEDSGPEPRDWRQPAPPRPAPATKAPPFIFPSTQRAEPAASRVGASPVPPAPVPAATASPSAAPPARPLPAGAEKRAVGVPVSRAVAPAVAGPGAPVGGATEGELILLIEDDERIAKFYSMLFQAKGFRVESAHDGLAGVDMAQSLRPALILLDVMMPRMNGLMVLQVLRANPDTEKTPVVVLSNYMEPPLIQRALQLGAIEYVVKSQARPEQLVNALPSWLKGEPAIH